LIRPVLLPVLLACTAACAAPLRIVTSDLPPMSFERDARRPGAMVEIVAELTRRAGVHSPAEFVPWKRALFMASTLPRIAIFPLTRTPERELGFRWLVPLYRERFVFMADKARADVTDLARLKGRRIAILRGSVQMENLARMGYTRLVPTVSVQEGLRFVHEGMADAIYGDEAILGHSLRVVYPGAAWAASAPLVSTTTWLGGSLDLGDDDAARLQAALKAMQADGSYARILRKYALPR
jgi:ABC-type amino acid transport substrate-binding protein